MKKSGSFKNYLIWVIISIILVCVLIANSGETYNFWHEILS